MKDLYQRTRRLIGREALEKLQNSRVLVFGLGGVGGHLTEALARSGVGTLGIVDSDRVDPTNCNRQIIALQSTIGRLKAEVMGERLRSIDPAIRVEEFSLRLDPSTLDSFDLASWDYIADAIDDVPAKLLLIREARRLGVPIVSSMGTGNKIDPSRLCLSTIDKSHTCPLARTIRRELGREGIRDLRVVFSDEPPIRPTEEALPGEAGVGGAEDLKAGAKAGASAPASISFVPATAGLLLASAIVRDLIEV